MADKYQEILRTYWGYPDFRGIQRVIIESIAAGKDTLGLMPTGGGKSITFQVPALAQEGVCIVITPLIALMKDQVLHLRERGILADAIYADKSRSEIIQTLENCIFGGVKILYVSPERLSSEIFQVKLRHMKVSFITVDEAHCISQWGYDFRPSYLRIADIRQMKPGTPVLALTATATPAVVDDIQDKLQFAEKNVFKMSFERKNLAYIVRTVADKQNEMIHILQCVEGSAIVYARSRKRTKEMAEVLSKSGIPATFYHAGLDPVVKDERQKMWQDDEVRVMVATNAFGMGIDKPDVRMVIHIDCPDSLEAYFQEAGRAGRDGSPAQCILLYSGKDVRTNDFLLQRSRETTEVDDEETRQFLLEQGKERLKQMTFYATSTTCLRHRMLQYFGDHSPDSCGNCSCCLTNYREEDATTAAKKIISCVYRAQKGGYHLSRTMTADVLMGSKKESLLRMRLDQLSTYGIIEKLSRREVMQLIDELIQREDLALRQFQEYQELVLTAGSVEIIRDQKTVMRRVPVVREKLAAPVGTKDPTLSAADNDLFQKLRQLRAAQAKHEGIPPYFIFSDATLRDMCRKKPQNLSEMRQVSGVGVIKAQKYGKMFLEELQQFLAGVQQ